MTVFFLLGQVMFALAFVKFDDKTIYFDGQTRPSKELIRIIRNYCNGAKPLIVQSADLQVVIQEKLVSISPDHFIYAK
jgi:hypothetical protein